MDISKLFLCLYSAAWRISFILNKINEYDIYVLYLSEAEHSTFVTLSELPQRGAFLVLPPFEPLCTFNTTFNCFHFKKYQDWEPETRTNFFLVALISFLIVTFLKAALGVYCMCQTHHCCLAEARVCLFN